MIRLGRWLTVWWGADPAGMPGWRSYRLHLNLRVLKYSFDSDWSWGRVKE